MWRGHRIGVVIPAYNEERHIQTTIAKLPRYVDRAFVVDDASTDDTFAAVAQLASDRVVLLRHGTNRGVGAAIATGYAQAIEDGCQFLCVMAGDNQMDGDDLETLLEAISDSGADYAKGNRFRHPKAKQMPLLRRWGSALLSVLTRQATGLSVDDTQCGFTVMRDASAGRLPLEQLWPRYGYPNHLLAMLASRRMTTVEVPVAPVYAGEKSGLRPWHFFTICGLIFYTWLTLGRGRRNAVEEISPEPMG